MKERVQTLSQYVHRKPTHRRLTEHQKGEVDERALQKALDRMHAALRGEREVLLGVMSHVECPEVLVPMLEPVKPIDQEIDGEPETDDSRHDRQILEQPQLENLDVWADQTERDQREEHVIE